MGNANSGPRPLPHSVKVARGVTRRDRLNAAEPQPPAGAVTKPDGLSPGAATVWDALAPVCMAMGTLTAADVWAFSTLCELQATLAQATRSKHGKGYTRGVMLQRATANTLRAYYAMFGLEPSSRSRISVSKPDKPVSKWAGDLG